MQKEKTVFKLYNDVKNMPKSTMYLRPICLGIGTGIGTFLGYQIVPDNKSLLSICAGATVGFLGMGVYDAIKFNKKKKNLVLSEKRLEVFKSESKKILDEKANLNSDNVLTQINFEVPFVDFRHYNTLFKDGGCILESKCDDIYNCEYYMLPTDESKDPVGIDLTQAVDVAYKMIPNKRSNKK